MSPDGTLRAHHLWKRFRVDRRRSALRDELERLSARVRRQPVSGWRYALRDVDFEVQPGESVGLVGANGSGKSTLLKILCRVMYPYAGRVEIAGRVGALIEVSSGIHPELTGRENAYLYGSLLGLPRRRVTSVFDEIVAFAELDTAIDRQVKFYSSGMKMRLGFAVAAFLEPDILLVDEVLAVGDASFQQKCLDRMRDVLDEGTTLVFVSHDLASVQATCSRGIWLNGGEVQIDGSIADALGAYRRSIEQAAEAVPVASAPIQLHAVSVRPGEGAAMVQTQGPVEIDLTFDSRSQRAAHVFLGISEGPANPVFSLRRDVPFGDGLTELRCSIARLPLPRGRYYVWVSVWRNGDILPWHPVTHFDVAGPELDDPPPAVVRPAPVHVEATWQSGSPVTARVEEKRDY